MGGVTKFSLNTLTYINICFFYLFQRMLYCEYYDRNNLYPFVIFQAIKNIFFKIHNELEFRKHIAKLTSLNV